MDETKEAARKEKQGNPAMTKELRSLVLAELGGGGERSATTESRGPGQQGPPKGLHCRSGPGLTRKQLTFPKTAKLAKRSNKDE